MKELTNCDRARIQWMATLDGEHFDPSAQDAQHLRTCPACIEWRQGMESMTGQLQQLSYPATDVDLWTTVRDRIQTPEARRSLTHRLLVIAALLVVWRALQLAIDLPFPLLHPLAPIAAAVAAMWQIAGDPLAIQTFAPELQKRGV